jgi:hypothetical protein
MLLLLSWINLAKFNELSRNHDECWTLRCTSVICVKLNLKGKLSTAMSIHKIPTFASVMWMLECFLKVFQGSRNGLDSSPCMHISMHCALSAHMCLLRRRPRCRSTEFPRSPTPRIAHLRCARHSTQTERETVYNAHVQPCAFIGR